LNYKLSEKQADYLVGMTKEQRNKFAKDAIIKGQVVVEWTENGKRMTHTKKVDTDEANEIWAYVRFLEGCEK
jgi:hypothetical protein